MPVWSDPTSARLPLFGSDGELIALSISVEPRFLEELLDALAQLDFPVNPELCHQPGCVSVEFPAYAGNYMQVRDALERAGFDARALQSSSMLPCTSGAGAAS
jgi:hypothetical protein